jgi:AAA domain
MSLKFVKPPSRPHVNVLLYGPPKSGKTAAACSGPNGTLLLNTDLPNAAWFAHSRDREGRIMELDYEGLDTLNQVAIELAKDHASAGGAGMVDTVVVDTVGELYRRLLDEVSDDALRKTLPQYGDAGTYVERFCRALCEAPINAVLVCHEAPVKNEATGAFEVLPLTGTSNPALGQKLMGMVDVVAYTGVIEQQGGTKEYVAQVINAQGRRGGDRFDVLDPGDGYRKLDLTEWFELIHGKQANPTTLEKAA